MDVFSNFASSLSGENGFLGTVKESAEGFVSALGSDILPNWTRNQLGMNSEPRYPSEAPTFYEPAASARLDNALWDTNSTVNKPFLQFSPGSILIIGLIFLGGVYFFKRM